MGEGDEKEKISFYSVLGLLSMLGVAIVVPIIGGVIAGVWMDGKMETKPLFTLLGLGLGLLSAGWVAYKMIMRSLK